ncbi:MAG: hypothetical protein D6826_07225 [Alphaproteobacteria bacterium]|nr:MAG: hypothetical protein D6826_07225 [Alphaproteobacteria bacterium]
MRRARRVMFRPAGLALLLFATGTGPAPAQTWKEPQSAAHGALFERLAPSDAELARVALQETLETRPSEEIYLWRNERTGRSGAITPLRTFRIKSGHFCREYRETVIVERKLATRTGVACRADDGTWVQVKG